MELTFDKLKDQIPYQSLLLSTCAGVAAILLVVMQAVTSPVIDQRMQEDQNALLSEVLNGKSFANRVFDEGSIAEFKGRTYQIYPVKNESGLLTHYVISGGEDGYSGEIRFLIGVDTPGKIEGVRILSHTETPGLGDKVELAKSDWVLSFNDRSLSNTPVWKVKKDGGDFDQFTGATITPRSVVKGVHNALLALESEKEK
ncbi:RnfABCDGE type electron transport complex subunit G [Vibrio hannami]|nr:RnfABCDGE type electron transport complex subunit G [Vibrio hannami]MDG3085042.1 RnfABCDGE type electron transport complex subunit G [Vibrio hannami]